MLDEIEEKLWKERQRLLDEEQMFEEHMEFLLERVDRIRALSDQQVLSEFEEVGGDPEVGAEEARQTMLESLLWYRW